MRVVLTSGGLDALLSEVAQPNVYLMVNNDNSLVTPRRTRKVFVRSVGAGIQQLIEAAQANTHL